MRLMSFAATTEQMRRFTKTVTRRLDTKGYWMRVLTPGTLVCAIEKGQGIPKGGQVVRIGVIEIVDVRREPLSALARHDVMCSTCDGNGIVVDPNVHLFDADPRIECPACYRGRINAECAAEGFGAAPADYFINLFCRINRCEPDVEVTRIEFRHRDDLTTCCGVGRLPAPPYACEDCGRV